MTWNSESWIPGCPGPDNWIYYSKTGRSFDLYVSKFDSNYNIPKCKHKVEMNRMDISFFVLGLLKSMLLALIFYTSNPIAFFFP